MHGSQLDPYFIDWHNAPVHTLDGHLQVQDVLTRGNALRPSAPGAVLRFTSAYKHAILPPQATTSLTKLKGQQQVYFVVSGQGKATAGSQAVALSPNIAVLVPEGLEFALSNSGAESLEMYLIQEPTWAGFHPNTSMLVRDENSLPFATTDLQWSYMVKKVFVASDGLATLSEVSTVSLDSLTISRPKSTESPDTEAVWTALRGKGIAFVSNDLRRMSPSMTYAEVPDDQTPLSMVNPDQNSELKFLYFAHKPAIATGAHRLNTK
jgi:mannose-6-phosphate isomerase-like protein (cupin superfamily)